MNYYTSTIPLPLAEKLKEKGMLIRYANRLVNACPNSTRRVDVIDKVLVCPMYAECFDWLMERGLRIVIEPSWDFANERITDMWDCDIVKVGAFSSQPKTTISKHDTWHEAAEKAIEMALELIK